MIKNKYLSLSFILCSIFILYLLPGIYKIDYLYFVFIAFNFVVFLLLSLFLIILLELSKTKTFLLSMFLSVSLQLLQYQFAERSMGIETIFVNLTGTLAGIYGVASIILALKLIFVVINNSKDYKSNYADDLESVFLAESSGPRSFFFLNAFFSICRSLHFAFNKIVSSEDNLKISLRTDTPHKIKFPIMSPSIVRHLLDGTSEKDTSVILLEQIKPGDIVWDVGAHYGYFSLKASSLTGDSGKVLSFEPTPSTYKMLEQNTLGITNIQTFNLGFFSHNTSLTFNDYGENYSALNSFHEPRLQEEIKFKQRYMLELIKIDDFLLNNEIPNIIKMDCESSELDILKGMDKTLKDHAPSFVMEFGDLMHKDIPRSRPIHDFMSSKGYTAFRRFKEGYKKVPSQDIYPYFNGFFVHDRNYEEFVKKNPYIE